MQIVYPPKLHNPVITSCPLYYCWLLNQQIQLLKSYDYESADFCGQLCVLDYPEKEHNPKTDFEYRIKKQFCDMEFNVINGYDHFLKHYFGNYMELPPVEKRVASEAVHQEYYWLWCIQLWSDYMIPQKWVNGFPNTAWDNK